MSNNATVLKFDRARGIGFAVPDDLTEDVFLHRLNLNPERKYLNPGDRIAYEMGEHDGRPCAVNIRYIGHVIARQVGEGVR
jgi:cold shock CspA family protein